MSKQVQISLDGDVYDKLQQLMVPPLNDANAVIRELLIHEGHDSRAAVSLGAAERKFTMEEELGRARDGVYDAICP